MSATKEVSLIIDDEAAMQRLAETLAQQIKKPVVIALSGDLGAGKTTFARAFIHAICDTKDEVVSPTFLLQQSYQTQGGFILHHFDFYRIKHVSELAQIGFEDALADGICLIEWPEIAKSMLPNDVLNLTIDHHGNGTHRSIHLSSNAPHWVDVLHHLDQRKPTS